MKIRNMNKTQPQLIPWSALSDSEKRKDYAFIERLPVILAEVGYEIFAPAEES